MNTKILNITFADKPFCNKEHFFPISAGTVRNDVICDNTGDNISDKNSVYGELTAVYWAWKNLKDVDIIGMSHYRRYMMHQSYLTKTHYEITWENFRRIDYNVDQFENDLNTYDIIFCKKWHFENLTIRQQFLEHHPFPEDLYMTRKILMEYEPDAVSVWDKYMSGSDGYCCCMFITKWSSFDELCSWMFPLLSQIEQNLDFSKYDNYQQRMIAFLYERLLNVYLELRNLKIKEYPFYFIDDNANKSVIRQDIGAKIWNVMCRFKGK